MDIITARRINKVQQAITNLPENPNKRIYWIVYNQDMIDYTKKLITDIRGEDYLENYVTVVAKSEPSGTRCTGTVYFDPGLHDLLSNGST